MAKATHQGTCQICGRLQRMPGGVMAKHGYKVAGYGFFVGTCQGSGFKPFELDKARAEEVRNATAAAALRTDEQADEQAADRDHVWLHHYDDKLRGWGRGGYRWLHLPVGEVNFGYAVEYNVDGKAHSVHDYEYHKGEQVARFNAKRAESTRATAASMRAYVKWQDERLRDWHPHPEALIDVVQA